jgi:hypothetical protein
MTSVTLTDLTQEQNITLSIDSANNSVAISQTVVTPTLSISLSAAGEVNTISNVGTGAGVYKEKVGTDLRLRSIVGGTGITATQNTDDITLTLGDSIGQIDTDLVPDGNETRDLGSLTNRWRDLYLSGTSIDLGGASITSDGSVVALPASSTAGGFRILTTNDDTDSIGEGTTNLFYTDARSRGAISVTQNAASGSGTLAYNSTTGVLTYTPPAPASETLTSLSFATNTLSYTDENGATTNIDLSLYLDDTNLARLTSGTLDGATGIATFTRDDATTFTVDFSDLLNITFADLSVTQNIASGNGTLTYNNTNGVFTYTPPDLSGYLTSFTETNDLTSAVTWANVPDANITQTSVTQHQAALSITQSQITDLDHYTDSDVDAHLNTSTATTNQILSWTGTDYAWVADSDVSGIELTDLSVTTTAAGSAALSYNNTTGVFTYTPPDLSSYLTAETNDLTSAVTWATVPDAYISQTSVTQHQAALSITQSQISDLDHYTDSDVDTHLNTSTATTGQHLQWNGVDYTWADDVAGIELTDLSVTTDTAANGGSLSYDNTTGVFTFAPADLSTADAATALNVVYTAVNKDTVSLAKGTPVYASGGTTSGQTVEVKAADASDPAKMPAIGVLGETLAVDGEGELLIVGQIQGVDTDTPGFSIGDVIYVAAGGGYTNTKPTSESNLIQNLGVVTKVHVSNGGGLIEGSGRSAATPNLNNGKIFIGNASNQATTATLDTSIVPENTNLYYTDARVDTWLTGGSATGLTTTGDVVVGGDLTVSGTTTTVNTETVTIADNQIVLNSNYSGSTPTENAGIEVNRGGGTAPNKTLVWDETADKWTVGTETFVANTFEGNLTGNVTGTISDISNHDTDALAEGVTNLYYTDARANSAIDARVDATFVEGLNIEIDGGTY